MGLPELSDEQRAKWAERLQRRVDRSDSGQEQPLTAAALAVPDPVERLLAVGRALEEEKVIVPINVEQHPDDSGEHHYIDPSSDDAPRMSVVQVGDRRGIAVYSSAERLNAADPQARPMRVDFRKVALAALVESGGCVIMNPHAQAVVMPRPMVAARAQGDSWLPGWQDEELLGELAEIARSQNDPRIQGVRVLPEANGAALRVDVHFAPGVYEAADRQWVMSVLEAIHASGRLQTAADRVTLVPVIDR